MVTEYMKHEEIKNLIAAYSLDALSDEEREMVDAHVQEGCGECHTLLQEMNGVTVGLAFSASSEKPPTTLKEQIFAQIGDAPAGAESAEPRKTAGLLNDQIERLKKSQARWRSLSWALGFALIVVVVGLSWYAVRLQGNYASTKRQAELGDLLIQELRAELAKKEEIVKVIQAPRLRLVDLQGQQPAQNAGGKVVWDPDQNKAVFYVFNLPPAASDKDYQLWMLRGSQPVDAGVFPVDNQGTSEPLTIDTITDRANLSAFAVTLEPKGGAPQPTTGTLYLLGVVPSP